MLALAATFCTGRSLLAAAMLGSVLATICCWRGDCLFSVGSMNHIITRLVHHAISIFCLT